jgi:hypothetical protein
MDYLFFSALRRTKLRYIVVSYDIACQWHKNLWKRVSDIPDCYQIDLGHVTLIFLVPKFHLPAHIFFCHINFSFNLTRFVGRTDGEGIERNWANINPVATSTREMGPGNRRDTLDDHFGDQNWKKTLVLGTFLLKLSRVLQLTLHSSLRALLPS